MLITENPDWFLFKEQKRKPFQRQNWIPLRANIEYLKAARFGDNGYLRDVFACGTVAVPLEARAIGDQLTWSDVGLNETRHYAGNEGYKPADTFRLDWPNKEPNAIHLVLCSAFFARRDS